MDPFPTVILLATDSSEDAQIASRMAASLAQTTGSELHLVYVAGTAAADPRVYEQIKATSRTLLDEQAEKMPD